MSRAAFTFLLVAIVLPPAFLRAAEPPRKGEEKADQGVLVLTGSNTYSGGTMISGSDEPLAVPPVRASQDQTGCPTITGGVLGGSGSVTYSSGLTRTGSGTLVLGGITTCPGGTISLASPATVSLGTNTYTGVTTISAGILQLGNGTSWTPANNNVNTGSLTVEGGTLLGTWGVVDADFSPRSAGSGVGGTAAATPTTPIPAGPVFYIITEGAGLGDSVRFVPCTGQETVLDAVGAVNGFSQVSNSKIWIARPSPTDHGKSTILTIDWEAISKRGINATNYTLMPGDRLVFGEDPLVTRSNLIGKKTAVVERLMGIIGLTNSTLRGLHEATAADGQVLTELVQKGMLTDDEELKQLLLEAIRVREEENKNAGPKAAAEQKTGQAEKSSTADPKAAGGTVDHHGDLGATGVVRADGGTLVIVGTLQLGSATALVSGGTVTAGEAPPHELALRPLPDYRIEPPDVIAIEMLRLVPLPPYRAGIFDVQKVHAYTPPDLPPIDAYYMVEAEGTIDLGPPYGSVKVAGMTKDEMSAAIEQGAEELIREPQAYVQLARVSGAQPVTGQYLVGPDGTVNLRQYGRVGVTGKTIAEARSAIQKHLATVLDSPELSVDVVAYNSKVYYVITQGAGLGDSVRRLPVTGKETVLDAISQINGLSEVSSKNIWIARPSASDPGKEKILQRRLGRHYAPRGDGHQLPDLPRRSGLHRRRTRWLPGPT